MCCSAYEVTLMTRFTRSMPCVVPTGNCLGPSALSHFPDVFLKDRMGIYIGFVEEYIVEKSVSFFFFF